MLYESIELLTTLSYALEIKSILKLKVMCAEFNGFSIILQLEKYTVFVTSIVTCMGNVGNKLVLMMC